MRVAVTNITTLPITYRWVRGVTPVSQAQLDTHVGILNLPLVQLGHAGSYSVQLSNAATAGTGLVSRIAPLVVVMPPSNVVARANSNAILRASVGTGVNNPVSFQWSRDGTPIPGGGGSFSSGNTNLTLTLTNVQAGDEGYYALQVTNSLGMSASFQAGLGLSAPVTLSNPAELPDGTFQLWLQGIAYQTHQVQFTTNLQVWTELLTVNYTNGFVPIVDPSATNSTARSYRALTKP
jgi:hypothetical protein